MMRLAMTPTPPTDPLNQSFPEPLRIRDRVFSSRLFIGSGKFASPQMLAASLERSGAHLVTVAVRRADPTARGGDPAFMGIDVEKVFLLPNTSGARNAAEALRLARLGRALVGHAWVKLEVTPDPATLMPDPVETLLATELLVKEGFTVLPYMHADPVLALRLQDAGAATVMPLAAPIGTNRGLRTRDLIEMILSQARVPVIVDAGIGLPSHAAEAMEIGASAVLVNTAIATAASPPDMAEAFRFAVLAGRAAFLSGPGRVLEHAEASSPLTGFLWDK